MYNTDSLNIGKDIITVENIAVTKDGRDVNIAFCPYNTGMSNIYNDIYIQRDSYIQKSITLIIFSKNMI